MTTAVVGVGCSSMGNTHSVYLWGGNAPDCHVQAHRLTFIYCNDRSVESEELSNCV